MALLLCASAGAQTYTTNTYSPVGSTYTFNFTVPAGVTSITFEGWGGGGRGGSRVSSTGASGGGAAGCYVKHQLTVVPNTTYQITLGAGSSSTSAGGDTTIALSTANTTYLAVAKGGASVANNTAAGATGSSTGCVGNMVIRAGGSGFTGSGTNGGGGGASASTYGTGVSATSSTGATAPVDGGNGGNGRTGSTGVGTAGSSRGGGGGGAYRSTSGTSNGGNGANGYATITYISSTTPEINVFSAYGVNVLDGDNTPSTTEGTDFGSALVTGGTVTRDFTIVNTGSGTLTVTTPFTWASGGSDFSATISSTSIASGASATLTITFDPSASGTRTGEIQITNNDSDENPYNFSVTGTGLAPETDVFGGNGLTTTLSNGDNSPSTSDGTDFGTQTVNQSISRTFLIRNNGTGTLTISGIALSGTNANQYSIVTSPATSLAAGAQTFFVVRFTPTSTGAKTATVTITNSDSNEGSYAFALTGTGSSSLLVGEMSITGGSPATDVPMFALASTTYGTDFGTINLGTSVTRTFTITNNAGLTLSSISASISSATSGAGFSISTSPSGTLLTSGATTTFVITFNPTTTGTKTAVVTVNNNDSNEGSSTYTFNITGIVTEAEINVSGGSAPTSFATGAAASATNGTAFGTEYVGTNSYTINTYTITNTGTGSLTIGTVTNSNTTDFTVSTISSPIAAGASTTFTIRFKPASTGAKTATISIANNDTTGSENPFVLNLTGTGSTTGQSEINIQGGTPAIDINNNDVASSADGTDFGGIYVTSGTISRTFTIQNRGNAALTIGAISFSGTGAADYSVTTSPATSVTAGNSTTFTVTFNPSTAGVRPAQISIVNGDNNENPFRFWLTGTGNTFADSDSDGVTDDDDIDDDNDGILDSVEQSSCLLLTTSTTSPQVFLNETFGTGTARTTISNNNPDATTTYTYGTTSLDDGQYTVFNSAQITTWANDYWYKGGDHTGDTNGNMALFNATDVPGSFYTTSVSGVTPGIEIEYSFWALNLDRVDAPVAETRNKPNIRVEIRKASDNTLITSIYTGTVSQSPVGATSSDWTQYSATFTTTESAFTVTFINNAPGGLGNDLAIDDIKITQKYCNMDQDDDPDIFDLDDDNDGIPDVVEGGFKAYSANKGYIDYTTSTVWTDANKNGLTDAIDPAYISNYYTAYVSDTDGDGVYDFMDLDSDNDGIFDIDEADIDTGSAANNGDGDIDGDGKGDGTDADADGILSLNDDKTGYGCTNKAYPVDSDGDGRPNYLDTTSFGTGGGYDIAKTIYASLDANNDGVIDGNTDSDKDGILNPLDTYHNNDAIGAPRNITNKKLYINFDGRNDYGEGPNYLSGLSGGTLMAWVKLGTSYAANGIVAGQDNFYIGVNASKQAYVFAKGTTVTFTTALSEAKWYHIAASYASGSLILYINGKAVQTGSPSSGSLASSTVKFTIARTAGTASNYFKGYIDEVRVFNTTLGAEAIQRMVYQEIDKSGTYIKGVTIPVDINATDTWASMVGYFRMDNFKNDVIDNYNTNTSIDDSSSNTAFTRIYNVKKLETQTAPLPFVTVANSTTGWNAAVDNGTSFIDGQDILDYDYAIIKVSHNVTSPTNFSNIGLIVDANKEVTVNTNTAVTNRWYLELNGVLDLEGKAQLIQDSNSTLATTSSGYIERDQQGTKNVYNYNYWSSPVSTVNSASNNNGYKVGENMRDGTTPSAPASINWTSGNDGSATTPITLSDQWIYTYNNANGAYSEWIYQGPTGTIASGLGFTLKGSGAAGSSQNYVFVGKPNNGTITLPVTANNLVLCGNPYPSALDAVQFIKDNISGSNANPGSSASLDGTLYFWQQGSDNGSHILASYTGRYASMNLLGSVTGVVPSGINGLGAGSYSAPKQYIPVGQGFFVQANTTGGSITFKNSQRIFKTEDDTNSTYLLRTSEPQADGGSETPATTSTTPVIKLGFNSVDHWHRQIAIGFDGQNATDGFDYGYDSINFDDFPSDMNFLQDTNKLVIQGVADFTLTASYPLTVKSDLSGVVRFEIDELENFDPERAIYLYDDTTGIYHDLKQNPAEVTIDAGTYDNRFFLRFLNPSLGTGENEMAQPIKVSYLNSNGTLVVHNNTTGTTVKEVRLFNIMGQQVGSWKVEATADQTNIVLPVSKLSTGAYIAKVTSDKGTFAQKVAIR